MTTTTHVDRDGRPSRSTMSRRLGYVVAIVVNVIGIVVAHHLLEWGWPRFLTAGFDDVLLLVTLSFAASITVNIVSLAYDPPWCRQLGEMITGSVGVAATIRIWQVFPFDFSDYSTNWSWLVHTLLVIAIVGGTIGVVVNGAKLATRSR